MRCDMAYESKWSMVAFARARLVGKVCHGNACSTRYPLNEA